MPVANGRSAAPATAVNIPAPGAISIMENKLALRPRSMAEPGCKPTAPAGSFRFRSPTGMRADTDVPVYWDRLF